MPEKNEDMRNAGIVISLALLCGGVSASFIGCFEAGKDAMAIATELPGSSFQRVSKDVGHILFDAELMSGGLLSVGAGTLLLRWGIDPLLEDNHE